MEIEIYGCVSNAQHVPGEHAPLIDWSIDDRLVIGARSHRSHRSHKKPQKPQATRSHQEPPGATRSHQEPPGARTPQKNKKKCKTKYPSISRSIQIETTAAVMFGSCLPARRPQDVISWLYSHRSVGRLLCFHVSMSGYLRMFACLSVCLRTVDCTERQKREIYVVYCATSCNVPVPSMQWSLAQGWTQKCNTLQCGPMQCNALCCAERQTKLMICNVKKI